MITINNPRTLTMPRPKSTGINLSVAAYLIPAGLLGAILLLPPGSKYLTMVLLIICNVISVLGVSGGKLLVRASQQ